MGKCYRTYRRPADRLLDEFRSFQRRWLGGIHTPGAVEFWALRDVSFDVQAGETVAIIGRNGSGKSTLLQSIAGTVAPTEGTVSVTGKVSALLELGAGFHPEFSGIENVRINAALLGLRAEVLAERMESILDFADIGDHAFLPVRTYSSGMYVRLAFAVMVHCDPALLIVDEALAVGDAAFQAKCMQWIRVFQDSGGSLLFVSHDVAAVRSLCHRAIYLEEGRIKDMGPAGEVTDHYLRDVLHAVNSTQVSSLPAGKAPQTHQPGSAPETSPVEFAARSADFEARWIKKRQGTGAARIRLVELLDEAGNSLSIVEFDSVVRVRIYVECLTACAASVNYKIRDRNLIAVAGADFLIAEHDLLAMEPDQVYEVEYRTRLPLNSGDYSLRLSITLPIEKHAQSVFVDIIEVALSFKVLPSQLGFIYTQIYLPNKLSVQTCPLKAEMLSSSTAQPAALIAT